MTEALNVMNLQLSGLNGSTPLGFLAGLGTLSVAADRRHAFASRPLLSWDRDSWSATLHSCASRDFVAEMILDDAGRWENSLVLNFRYPKREKDGVKFVRGLTPPVAVWRARLLSLLDAQDDVALEFAAALCAESAAQPIAENKLVSIADLVTSGVPFDRSASIDACTLPTFFDFTARNEQFLDQVRVIRSLITKEAVVLALDGGQLDVDARTLRWDASADRPAALYASSNQPNPVLEWLGFRALGLFPSFGKGSVLQTTACRGRRKAGAFIWPVWSAPCDVASAKALLMQRDLERTDPTARRARGILQVFRAELGKAADGYGGIFSPARTV